MNPKVLIIIAVVILIIGVLFLSGGGDAEGPAVNNGNAGSTMPLKKDPDAITASDLGISEKKFARLSQHERTFLYEQLALNEAKEAYYEDVALRQADVRAEDDGFQSVELPDGTREEGEFVNNLKQGWHRVYDKEGNILSEGEYKDGILISKAVEYNESGQKTKEVRADGTYAVFADNGQPREMLIKDPTDRSGSVTIKREYYENGALKREQKFFNGAPGEIREFTQTGYLYNEDGTISNEKPFQLPAEFK